MRNDPLSNSIVSSPAANRNNQMYITNHSDLNHHQVENLAKTKFEFEHIEDPEKQFKRNKFIQFRESKTFVPYKRERNNIGYVHNNPINDAMSEEVWKNLDMTLQEKL